MIKWREDGPMPEELLIKKYPRTPHLEGSRLQPGDEDLNQIPFSDIAGRYIVVEEKCDGANSAVSFDRDGTLLLQSRGHYLTGGWRERHYNLFKQWANVHRDALYKTLLRKKRPFVWNATNVTADLRQRQVQLFTSYHASVRIVYLETEWNEELRRNKHRAAAVPEDAILRMLAKLTPPEPFEAHRVEWRCL